MRAADPVSESMIKLFGLVRLEPVLDQQSACGLQRFWQNVKISTGQFASDQETAGVFPRLHQVVDSAGSQQLFKSQGIAEPPRHIEQRKLSIPKKFSLAPHLSHDSCCDDRMLVVRTIAYAAPLLLLAACSKPKPQVPQLTPQGAAALLQFDNKAHNWITYVRKHDPTCEYKVDLPDQSNQPTEIDIDHVVSCGGRPAPKEYDASVVFTYDASQSRWAIQRFQS